MVKSKEVVVKQDRVCCFCGKIIQKGTRCITFINSYSQKRVWCHLGELSEKALRSLKKNKSGRDSYNIFLKNRNYVKVRQNRKCSECGCLIPKGSECFTLNMQSYGRKWVCNCCISCMDFEDRYLLENGEEFFNDELLSWDEW